MLALLAIQTGPSELDRILSNPKLDGAIVSAMVTDLTGKVIYEKNSSTHMVPASNQKLLSNSFALWELGPDYRPSTRFWKFPGRIVIDSSGDAMMSYDELEQTKGLLRGPDGLPVFVHQEYAPLIPESWDYGDLPNKYAASVCALTFDRGGFALWSKKKKAVLVPAAFGVSVKVHPAAGPARVQYDPFARVVTVTGTLPSKDAVLDTLALPRPDEAAASIFGHGFQTTSEIPSAPPTAEIVGHSIMQMVAACLPPSDNNLAENLLLLGARKEGELGEHPYPLASKRLRDFLVHVVGVDSSDIHPVDGCGLSRQDYLTTRSIVKLLCWADSQPTGTQWHAALAHAGTGTLSTRLKGIQFDGKTGSLNMVSSLSGYLTTQSGKKLVVSIILNQMSCTQAEAHAVQDAVVRALAKD